MFRPSQCLVLFALSLACDSATEPADEPEHEVSLSKTALSESPTAPANIGFSIEVSNDGVTAASVVLNDTLPAGLVWSDDRPECGISATRLLSCAIDPLVSGQVFEVQVTTFASTFDCAAHSSSAHVSGDQVTPVNVTATITVSCPAGQPTGSLSGRTNVTARPFALDASALGDIYVARLDAEVARGTVPFPAVSGLVDVGFIPRDVAFSPDGATAFVTNEGAGSVSVVDVATHTEITQVPVTGSPFRVKVSPAGDRVYVTGNADSVFVVDPSGPAVIASVGVDLDPNGLAFSAGGDRLYVSSSSGTTISEIDLATNTVVRTFPLGESKSQDLAVSHDGSTLYIAMENSARVLSLDLSTGTLGQPFNLPAAARPFGLALTPSGAQLYVSGGSVTGAVYIIDIASGAFRDLDVGGNPRRPAFSADGAVAFFANESGWVDVIQ